MIFIPLTTFYPHSMKSVSISILRIWDWGSTFWWPSQGSKVPKLPLIDMMFAVGKTKRCSLLNCTHRKSVDWMRCTTEWLWTCAVLGNWSSLARTMKYLLPPSHDSHLISSENSKQWHHRQPPSCLSYSGLPDINFSSSSRSQSRTMMYSVQYHTGINEPHLTSPRLTHSFHILPCFSVAQKSNLRSPSNKNRGYWILLHRSFRG